MNLTELETSELFLPPLLNAIMVEKPFQTAIDKTQARQAGAGDFFWAQDPSVSDFAIVLEPDVSFEKSLEIVPLALVALSDCLASILPPQVAVQFRDFQNVTINGGVAGSVNAAISKTQSRSDIPDWLIISINITLTRDNSISEPGSEPDITALGEEGWDVINQNTVLETYSRHFLSWLANWTDDGFDNVVRAWKFKAENEQKPDMDIFEQSITLYESTG